MPSRAIQQRLRALQATYAELQCQVQKELQEQNLLLTRHLLLKGVCDGLANFKANLCADDHGRSSALSQQYEQRCEELRQLEDQLLVLLQDPVLTSAEASAPALTSAEASAQPQVFSPPSPACSSAEQSVAPPNDPLALFQYMMAQPPVPAADKLTVKDVARMLRITALEASVNLHQLKSNMGAVASENHAAMAQLWTRFFHTISSLTLKGRSEVVDRLMCVNLMTLEEEPDSLATHTALYAAMPPLLGLTQQQLQMVAAGVPLFRQLMQAVVDERQQLQAKLVAEAEEDSASSGPSSSTSSSLSGSLNSSSMHDRQLERDERNACRVKAVYNKDYVLRAAAAGWWVGTLSWRQLTLAQSLSWPYPLRQALLSLEVGKYAQQQLQQQQQTLRQSEVNQQPQLPAKNKGKGNKRVQQH